MKKNFLSLIGAAEKQSEHPLAEAIVQGIQERDIELPDVEIFEAIPGYGVKAIVNGKEVLVGTRKLMNKYDVRYSTIFSKMEELEANGKTAMLAGIDGQYAGLVAVADTIKDTSKNSHQTTSRNGY